MSNKYHKIARANNRHATAIATGTVTSEPDTLVPAATASTTGKRECGTYNQAMEAKQIGDRRFQGYEDASVEPYTRTLLRPGSSIFTVHVSVNGLAGSNVNVFSTQDNKKTVKRRFAQRTTVRNYQDRSTELGDPMFQECLRDHFAVGRSPARKK
ncbi:hypothetical protein CSKR_103860, partial [Clonorchis sinensis]